MLSFSIRLSFCLAAVKQGKDPDSRALLLLVPHDRWAARGDPGIDGVLANGVLGSRAIMRRGAGGSIQNPWACVTFSLCRGDMLNDDG